MSLPRTIWVAGLAALVSTGLAVAFSQEPGNNAQPARPERPEQAVMDMPRLLTLWEGQSAKLKTLEVDIYRVDKNTAWNDEEHYQGHAAFRSLREAYLDFSKLKLQQETDPKDKTKKVLVPVKKNGQFESKPFERMVCTGKEAWQYRFDVKQIFIFPLDDEQRQRAASRKAPCDSCST